MAIVLIPKTIIDSYFVEFWRAGYGNIKCKLYETSIYFYNIIFFYTVSYIFHTDGHLT